MIQLSRVIAAGLIAAAAVASQAHDNTVRGVWVGQDGHDYCQTARALGPNDIQDLHIRLEGLPADKEIDGVFIRRAGGGEWAARNAGGQWTWKARLVREAASTAADLFMEPSHDEKQFKVDVEITYSGGATARLPLICGRSDPNRFMPSAELGAKWAGARGADWTGPGPGVGPDGFEDVAIEVTGISTRLELKSVRVQSSSRIWEYGLNPERHSNAELIRNAEDKSRGILFFSPDRDLSGEQLLVHVAYAISRSNAVALEAGASDPARRMPAPMAVALTKLPLDVKWLGQDGMGDLRISVLGVPDGRRIEAAALSDVAGGFWIYRRERESLIYPAANSDSVPNMPMALRERAGNRAVFSVAPYRDESGTPMMIRLALDDGRTVIGRFIGGKCDPYQHGEQPRPTRVNAKPGDDLNALAREFGEVRLSPGRYVLTQPLTLSRPVTIRGSRDAVLHFTQTPDQGPWHGGILVGAGNTTLNGFSLRFTDNFRWAIRGPQGAALVRSFHPPGSDSEKVNITLSGLDIESSTAPLPTDPKDTPEAPYLVRFPDARSGRIVGNRLRGGTVDVNNGPWVIRNNEHRGTQPGTFAWDAFGGHWLHDFTLEGNRVFADGPSGKTWRLISMNQIGQRVTIRSNDVSGVGMRDDDTIPNPNAPEILLTESYRLSFEGKPAAISEDGEVLQIPMVMYGAIRAGSVVSILTGKHAGEYRMIAQPLAPTIFLMQDSLPSGDYVASIAHGYVETVIEGNRIDVRGGKSAVVVLGGNHWGVTLRHNYLLGGGDSMLLQSTPTENPFIWGWSHTPFFGLLAEGNIIEDSRSGASLDIHSNRHNKTTEGRTYMTGVFRDNRARWRGPGITPLKEPFRIGPHSDTNGGRFRVIMSGNRVDAETGH